IFVPNPEGGFYLVVPSSLPLAIGSVSPSQAAAAGGTQATIHGSGFQPGCGVAFNAIPAIVSFVDQNTLGATLPALSPGLVRITVTNPGGEQFSTDTSLRVF